jgi:hypothetical protein
MEPLRGGKSADFEPKPTMGVAELIRPHREMAREKVRGGWIRRLMREAGRKTHEASRWDAIRLWHYPALRAGLL